MSYEQYIPESANKHNDISWYRANNIPESAKKHND